MAVERVESAAEAQTHTGGIWFMDRGTVAVCVDPTAASMHLTESGTDSRDIRQAVEFLRAMGRKTLGDITTVNGIMMLSMS